MKNVTLALLLLAFTAVQIPGPVLAGPAEDVKAAMQLLKSEAATLGAPSVKGRKRSLPRRSPPYISARPR